jgi:hypothetical protein
MSFSKINLWLGRSLWGMQVRDEQCLLDYLATRADIDPGRIGATGMSMGSTRSWWLAAVDERVKAIVGVVCFTRYTELIQRGYLRYHGICYSVPEMLQHFDTEAIHAWWRRAPTSNSPAIRIPARRSTAWKRWSERWARFTVSITSPITSAASSGATPATNICRKCANA